MTEINRQSYEMNQKDVKRRIRMREIYRYMGMKEAQADEALQAAVREQLDRLLEAAQVRSYYRIYPLTFGRGGESDSDPTAQRHSRQGSMVQENMVQEFMALGPMSVRSRDLAKNLNGCDFAALFGVTLGLEVDRLIYRLGRTAVGQAVIVDACAAEVVEVVCDEMCDRLRAEAAKLGRAARPRYSPGFGDFTLEYQPAILQTLELSKRIGVHLTAGGMMTPTKSVTAVVGFYDPAAGGQLRRG